MFLRGPGVEIVQLHWKLLINSDIGSGTQRVFQQFGELLDLD